MTQPEDKHTMPLPLPEPADQRIPIGPLDV